MEMLKRLTVVLGVTALAAAWLPAQAQTPDGETPAVEKVCDVVKDGTPGLYGLCVAYCEAQDADLALFSGDILAKTSHERLLANYRKKMRPGDPDMPCLKSPCPCFDAADVAAIGTVDAMCAVDVIGLGGHSYYRANFGAKCDKGSADVMREEGNVTSCFYRLDRRNADGKCETVKTTMVTNLSPEEIDACIAAIEDGAAQNNVECTVIGPE